MKKIVFLLCLLLVPSMLWAEIKSKQSNVIWYGEITDMWFSKEEITFEVKFYSLDLATRKTRFITKDFISCKRFETTEDYVDKLTQEILQRIRKLRSERIPIHSLLGLKILSDGRTSYEETKELFEERWLKEFKGIKEIYEKGGE